MGETLTLAGREDDGKTACCRRDGVVDVAEVKVSGDEGGSCKKGRRNRSEAHFGGQSRYFAGFTSKEGMS